MVCTDLVKCECVVFTDVGTLDLLQGILASVSSGLGKVGVALFRIPGAGMHADV